MFGMATITLGIGPHISSLLYYCASQSAVYRVILRKYVFLFVKKL